MSIFNSLGSNYDLGFVLKSLLNKDPNSSKKLTKFLEEKYSGKTILTYKGREAIELGLSSLKLPKGSKIAINGFTCFAVYKAISDSRLEVFYLDIEEDLNFSPKTLEKALKNEPSIRAVMVQNTLGYPCDIKEIKKICKKHKISLIEDLAHSVGASYSGKDGAGRMGDLTILSFSQDKIIDGVSGGALISRSKSIKHSQSPISSRTLLLDRLYPLFTYLIRKSYPLYFGKLLHFYLKLTNLLSKPVEVSTQGIHYLDNYHSNLILSSFESLDKDLERRKILAKIYANTLDKSLLSKRVVSLIDNSSNLRFPIFVKERASLINFLKREGIYVSDIWYDAPVSPKKFLNQADYTNGCPNSEKISEKILNLPTHKNVSLKQAQLIASKVNQWLKLK